MATITKKELIDRIAERTGNKRVVVKRIIQNFLDEVIGELSQGNRLEFRDFGVFEVKERAPRIAQNPKTMEKVKVPAKATVKFKVGRMMKIKLHDEEEPWYRPLAEERLSHRTKVEIYLPNANPLTDLEQIEQLRDAVDAVMTMFGFELDPDKSPLHTVGSWYEKLFYRPIQEIGKALSSKPAREVYREMEEALKRRTIDQFGAETYHRRADATACLLREIAQIDSAVLRLGDILIAKATINGKSRLLIETISPQWARELDGNPAMMRDPEALFRFVDCSRARLGKRKAE